MLCAVLNHALSQDGLDCSDSTFQEFNAFKTAKRTTQAWLHLSEEGVTELDPQLPVLERAVRFDKDRVHSALKTEHCKTPCRSIGWKGHGPCAGN